MVRTCVIVLLTLSFNCFGQQQEGYAIQRPPVYKVDGLLSASATFAPGFMIHSVQTNYHLNAFAEYHINQKVSVKSDSYWFLNSPNANTFDLKMLRSQFGMFYHFNENYSNWDVKLGLLPGVMYSQRAELLPTDGVIRINSVAPSLSVAAGFDYYIWKYFHFFSQVSYVHATARGLYHGPQRMDEVLITAGLGFQIPTRRPKSATGLE